MPSQTTPMRRRNFLALSALAASVASISPVGQARASTSIPKEYDEALLNSLKMAKLKVREGETLLLKDLNEANIWIQKQDGKVFTQVTTLSDTPISSTELPNIIAETLKKQSHLSTPTPDIHTYSGNTCTMAYALASLIVGIGSLGLAALALANPGGAFIGGYFFTAAQLSEASLIAGSFSLVVGWVGNFVC